MRPEFSASADNLIAAAVRALAQADGLFIGAGAGMGVDSGLPDFRGNEGFWNAYPPFAALGLSFSAMANPRWFAKDPTLAWGFYGHRQSLYRDTVPHAGFDILLRWARAMPLGAFVFTSNVDGQFQKAGFPDDMVCECHGSIHVLQCVEPCSEEVWPIPGRVGVDTSTFRVHEPLPRCIRCQRLARPNVLMFGDGEWLAHRTEEQTDRMNAWLASVRGRRIVVVECGAGSAVPTVRWTCEGVALRAKATLVRINPREPDGPEGTMGIAVGAAGALRAMDQSWKDRG